MNNNVKVSNKEICIPHKLLENIIKETDIQQVVIEEEETELFFTSLTGQGKIYFKNNTTYEGNIKYGILDSGEEKKTCKINFPNSTRYEGDIKQNQISGSGTYYFPTGSIYKGEVKNGLRNGYGVYNSTDGIKYEGNWWNGLKHGFGKLVIKENMIYEGEWVEGIKHGNGRIRWPSGNFYDGEFKKNKIAGNGYMIWVEKYEKYTGHWNENLQNGLGIHIWYENKGEHKFLRNRYVGEWKNGFRHGYGVFFYANGSKYEGLWDQNYKHGFGIFTFHDGAQFIGRFHNDKMIEYNPFGYLTGDNKQGSNQEGILTTTGKHGKIKNPVPVRKNSLNKKIGDIKEIINENIDKNNKDKVNEKETAGNSNNYNLISNNINQNTISNLNNNKENSAKEDSSKDDIKQSIFGSTSGKLGFGKIKADLKTNFAPAGLEAISEQAELGNVSMIQNEKKEKEHSTQLSYNNLESAQALNSLQQTKQSVNNRALKESEYNIFKTLIDLSDIIECDTEIERGLKEVENILLRNLSEMKVWYKYYSNKESQKEDVNSVNASSLNTQQDEKDKLTSKDVLEKKSSMMVNIFGVSNLNNPSFLPNNLECIYNNDLGFAMELKDLWRFLRDSNIICSDFSLAQFDRLFFKGKKNYIEMFMCPDDIDSKNIYDYLYSMIIKSKEDFYIRYRDKLLTNTLVNNVNGNVIGKFNNLNNSNFSKINQGNSNNQNSVNNSISNNKDQASETSQNKENHNIPTNKGVITQGNSNHHNTDNASENNKYIINPQNFSESNFDMHNKKQTILIRQFFEAIVRASYLRFFHVNQTLGSKLTILIDTCIKNNLNFKKGGKKSNREQTENSINNSVYIDKKTKVFESNFEFFTFNFEKQLKIIFKKYYFNSSPNPRLDDMTITHKFFYETYVSKSEHFRNIFPDKFKFVEIINIYHKDKIIISENSPYTKELLNYVENIYDIEMIFFEFCEVIYFMSRKYFIKNAIMDTRENYSEIIRDLENNLKNPESFINIKRFDKNNYLYPKLKNHIDYENLIANKLAKEEEERRKKKEMKRIDYERKMMEIEDMNILPESNEEEEEEDDYSMESY